MSNMTLPELIEAYKTGELAEDDILWLDNDTTFIYVGDEDAGEEVVKVFDMHPGILLKELLDYVGIPHEGV